jgi:hypothetical protein
MGEDDALLVEEAMLVVLIAQASAAIAATDTDEGHESQVRVDALQKVRAALRQILVRLAEFPFDADDLEDITSLSTACA